MTTANMSDPWLTGPPYERFMGRWSRVIARRFIEWLSPLPELRWLDFGCGTGALSETILLMAKPVSVLGLDPSPAFIAFARERLADTRISLQVGSARDLPIDTHSFDIAVSGLVLNFIPEPGIALQTICRGLRPGGMSALYVWDYGGKMEMLRYFWDSAAALDPQARVLDEGNRFPQCQPDELKKICVEAGLHDIEIGALEAPMPFTDFDDYWSPFLGGQGPAPGYVAGLGIPERKNLETRLRTELPFQKDGSLHLVARAWAVRARA